jgi:hypothetical protein
MSNEVLNKVLETYNKNILEVNCLVYAKIWSKVWRKIFCECVSMTNQKINESLHGYYFKEN